MHRSPTSILLDEWGTSGRKRATLNDLLNLLVKVQLYRAAEFVAAILNIQPPKRPETGPGARIDITLPPETFDEKEIERFLNNAAYPNSSRLMEQLDSIINNNNRDFSNSVSVDHVKPIREFFPTSSEESGSDVESYSHSDMIVFSIDKNIDVNEQQPHQAVFSLKESVVSNCLSGMTSNNSSFADSVSDWSAHDQLPNIPNISAIKSVSSRQYSHSNIDDSQVASALIPDIGSLQLHTETNSSSILSSTSNGNADASNETYIPNLSLLNGINS